MYKLIKYSKNILALIGLGTCLFLATVEVMDFINKSKVNKAQRELSSVNDHAEDLATQFHLGLVVRGYKLNPDLCMKIVEMQGKGEL